MDEKNCNRWDNNEFQDLNHLALRTGVCFCVARTIKSRLFTICWSEKLLALALEHSKNLVLYIEAPICLGINEQW